MCVRDAFFWKTAWRAVSVPRYANGWQSAIAVPEGTRDEAPGLNDYEREKIVVLRVRDVRGFYARLAADFHSGRPGTIASVSGTNGKTSTVCFLRDLWGEDGRNAVSLGTLGLQARDKSHSNLEARTASICRGPASLVRIVSMRGFLSAAKGRPCLPGQAQRPSQPQHGSWGYSMQRPQMLECREALHRCDSMNAMEASRE
jgi:hypothetical protein